MDIKLEKQKKEKKKALNLISVLQLPQSIVSYIKIMKLNSQIDFENIHVTPLVTSIVLHPQLRMPKTQVPFSAVCELSS